MSTASLEQLAFALPYVQPASRPQSAASTPHRPAPLEFDQPVLRPVAFFVRFVLVAPARARDICVPPAQRKPKDFRYRRQREGRKPLSIGRKPMKPKERREMEIVDYQATILGIKRPSHLKLFECPTGPCARFACKYNLYLDEIRSAVPGKPPTLKLNFPGLDVDELLETCAMRVANRAEELNRQTPTAEVAKLFNLTDERLRQIEVGAIKKLGPAVENLRPVE
jgi:hypothetical protein